MSALGSHGGDVVVHCWALRPGGVTSAYDRVLDAWHDAVGLYEEQRLGTP